MCALVLSGLCGLILPLLTLVLACVAGQSPAGLPVSDALTQP